jgi:UDP-N-acetylglucosamine 1-carboxyvinyltransferase
MVMDAFRIRGGRPLSGEVEIGGAKNAALPIMAAALLIQGKTVIQRVPRLRDVATMRQLLEDLGAGSGHTDHDFEIDATGLSSYEASWDIVRRMRASVYVLGPLLARLGRARVSLPGGCAWGPRPVDLHIKGMELLGARVSLQQGYVVAQAPPGGLRGARIAFDVSSVGATGNVLMAASLAAGMSVIENAACEPEIVALADFLNAAGARITGQGTPTIEVHGVAFLRPITFENIPDRIEAGTYLAAAALAGGNVRLLKVRPDHLTIVLERLREMGVVLEEEREAIRVEGAGGAAGARGGGPGRLRAADVLTRPFPGFPTDLQAQFMALLSVAEGTGVVTETIYPDRFTHVPELVRLGADITLRNNVATVRGVDSLEGAHVTSTDIRASSALVLAGLVARGETHVHRVYHIDRGYEAIEERLRGLGADIERYEAPGP